MYAMLKDKDTVIEIGTFLNSSINSFMANFLSRRPPPFLFTLLPFFTHEKIKVIHPITRLILGGAQQNTMETCAGLNKDRFEASIISGPDTGPEGELISEVKKRGIPLTLMPEIVRRPDL